MKKLNLSFERKQEITQDFFNQLDKHLADITSSRSEQMYEIRDFADLLHIHPTHLSNSIKAATGHSPCYFMEHKLIEIAKLLLQNPQKKVSEIARTLTYDPSNFTKFFKRYTDQTPKQYRALLQQQHMAKEFITD